MTPEQFDALAQLLRLQPTSPSREAARLVLVEGVTGVEAARRLGLTQPAVSRAVSSCRRGMELARVAAGMRGDQPAATASKP